MSTGLRHDAFNDHHHEGPRVVPMRILSLGMSRTATSSAQRAYARLGYWNIYHGFKVWRMGSSETVRWERAAHAKWGPDSRFRGKEARPVLDKAFWDDLLGNCQVISDLPAVAFWEEIWEAYKDDPELKVVLNVRPTDAWHKSFSDSIIRNFLPDFKTKLMIALDAEIRAVMFCSLTFAKYFWKSDGARTRDPSITRGIYEEHNAKIIATIPKDRLLLWGPQDGWEPLCKFLDRPIPNEPMPRTNDKVEFALLVKDMHQMALRRIFTKFAFLGLFGAVAYYVYHAVKF